MEKMPMDPVQVVMIFISLTITTLIVVLGVQVFYILKEMRSALTKLNEMLDDGTKVSGVVSNTVEGMSGLLGGVKAGLSLFSKLRRRRDDDE